MSSQSAVRKPLLAAAASVTVLMFPGAAAYAAWSVEEKTISDLEYAYFSGLTTPTEVVGQYLDRIETYNDGPGGLNAIASINPNLMAEVAQVESLINGGATVQQYPLLGVPVIVKDSYDARGQITTNGVSVLNGVGTPGSTTMVAPNDAFSVAKLREAGAIIMGKANLSTMAYSFNGIDNAHGAPLNPYQPVRQPGGSSSGSGVAVAANFAMLTMGGETGGSIRIPSNANALVGLKTSLGLIDPGGTWPLTPSRDVVGPMAKSVSDVAIAMNALVKPSANNLFNDTPFYPTADPGTVRPANYADALNASALQGKVLAVPKSMAGVVGATQYEGNLSPLVKTAFESALEDIRAQGATVVYVDVPASQTYYTTLGRPGGSGGATTAGFPYPYPTTSTPGSTTPSNTWSSWAAAYYYQKQIEGYNDPVIKNLRDFASALEAGAAANAGSPLSTLGGAASNIDALADIWEAGNAKGFGDADNNGTPDNPDAMKALQAFASLRMDQFEGFMADPNLPDDPSTSIDESELTIDAFVAPTYGTIMPYVAAALRPPGTPPDPYAISGGASLLGRFEANILGSPSVSVPMGYAPDGTPMGIQFFNEFLGEAEILGYAYDYEQATRWRVAPDLSFVPEPSSALAVMVLSGIVLARRRRVA